MDQRFRTDQVIEEVWARHAHKLAESEARYNLILGLLDRQRRRPEPIHFYSFDRPGALAIQNPGRNLVLGALLKEEIVQLAQSLDNIPGVVGADDTAQWFAEKANQPFLLEKDQRIYEIKMPPKHPKVPGFARRLEARDRDYFHKWMFGFHEEATPHDPALTEEKIWDIMRERFFYVWENEGQIRGMAGIVRETPNGSVVGPVYVPPEERGHCYGEAVTAALTELIFSRGKASASLYTDASNPVSNKIYERIGYLFVCGSQYYRKN